MNGDWYIMCMTTGLGVHVGVMNDCVGFLNHFPLIYLAQHATQCYIDVQNSCETLSSIANE